MAVHVLRRIGCLLACAALFSGCDGYRQGQIYCATGAELLLIEPAGPGAVEDDAILWSWRPEQSSQIDPRHYRHFRGLDECKPVMNGSAVLVTSSGPGGVALVRRSDSACLFYAPGTNAHSAAMIGEDILAVALSFRGDALRLYRLGGEVPATSPDWSMPLRGGHGVLWDATREVLWALGSRELLQLSIVEKDEEAGLSAEVLGRWVLPVPGGHDLSAWDKDRLVVTVDEGVFLFDCGTKTFAPLAPIAEAVGVKSVSRHPQTRAVLFTQWDERIQRFGAEPYMLAGRRVYKARWNAPEILSASPYTAAEGVSLTNKTTRTGNI